MPGTSLLRGRIYGAVFEHTKDVGEKYYLVMSNNRRNAAFPQVLAVRMTTTRPKGPRPSVVEVDRTGVFTGYAVCDDIVELYPDEVTRERGALSPREMERVEAGLRAALGL
ncbi:MAG TPA: type II toxin-antitoxin system PemK/MazF family toxin [Streptosporangiaceae bacterium]|nr:type II toxin-antitoxin system PemK/MazF family toxin [Streptosporangiaceae bacterium]